MKELAVAKGFGENWGYLRARPEECKPRAFETRLVKYFDKGSAPRPHRLETHLRPGCSHAVT
jgi:hypothetical protein